MIWTKESVIVQFFRLLSALMKLLPVPHAKGRVYSDLTSLFSAMKDNSYVFFLLRPYIVSTKRTHRSKIFRILSGWVKIYQLPHVIFETTFSFSLNVSSIFSFMRDNTSVLFLAETLYHLDKRNASKWKFSDFQLFTWNFTKFVLS